MSEELFEHSKGQGKEDEDSKAIDDMHCKLIYLAHKNTKNTTIAEEALSIAAYKNAFNYHPIASANANLPITTIQPSKGNENEP